MASAALSAQAQDAAAANKAQSKQDATNLDKIVVTAQSREQELRDVPIALQVVDASTIDNTAAKTIGDLDSFIPGLEVSDTQATQTRFTLRGQKKVDG